MNYCVAILSYNHPEITSKCLKSVLSLLSTKSIYLIHNGSDEKNIQFLQNEFATINHLIMEKNKGYSGGVNYIFENCFKEFDRIVFLTNDIELVNFPKNLPREKGLYAPLVFFRKIEKIDSLGGFFEPSKLKLTHVKDLYSFEHFFKERRFFKQTKIPYVPGTAFVIDKEIYLDIGKMDESLHTYWEDVDFSARAYLRGHKIGVIKDLQVLHRVGKTCHQKPFYTTYLFQRNKRIISLRYTYLILKSFVALKWFISTLPLLLKFYRSNKEKFSLLLKTFR